MRDQVIAGIRAGMSTRGVFGAPLDDQQVATLADAVLAQLAAAGVEDAVQAVLPAATPVTMVSPISIVAQLADAALRGVEATWQDTPAAADAPSRVVVERIAAGADYRAFKQLVLRLAPVFGVAVRVKAATTDTVQHFLTVGHVEVVTKFRSALDVLHTVGSSVLAAQPEREQVSPSEFWAALAVMLLENDVTSHEDVARRARSEADREMLIRFGGARTLPRVAEPDAEDPVWLPVAIALREVEQSGGVTV